MDKEGRHATSSLLRRVVTSNTQDSLGIGEIKNALHERGFGILLAIVALPLCIPIPTPPGYTTLFAIPIFIFAVQMIIGHKSPWLPNWITQRKIKRTTLSAFVTRANRTLRKLEALLRPRLTFAGSRTGEKVVGVFCFIFAISIAVPLPFTNLPPGWGVLLMSLGLLSKDGLVVIIGMIVGTLGVAITCMILIYGSQVLELLPYLVVE